MVKSFISIVIVSVILFCGAIFENKFITDTFNDFDVILTSAYEKVDEKTATEDDMYAVQSNWVQKKKYLHAFIPHNEIKEFDLWIAESVKLVRDKKWEDAISKIEVLKELTEQVPLTFSVSFENIF